MMNVILCRAETIKSCRSFSGGTSAEYHGPAESAPFWKMYAVTSILIINEIPILTTWGVGRQASQVHLLPHGPWKCEDVRSLPKDKIHIVSHSLRVGWNSQTCLEPSNTAIAREREKNYIKIAVVSSFAEYKSAICERLMGIWSSLVCQCGRIMTP